MQIKAWVCAAIGIIIILGCFGGFFLGWHFRDVNNRGKMAETIQACRIIDQSLGLEAKGRGIQICTGAGKVVGHVDPETAKVDLKEGPPNGEKLYFFDSDGKSVGWIDFDTGEASIQVVLKKRFLPFNEKEIR